MMLKKIVFVVLLILAIAATAVVVWNYPAYRDIDLTLDRCAVSVDGGTMADCLNTVVDNMDAYGITSGHSGPIPNPVNDIAQDYEALQGLRDRAWTIAQYPIEHQGALLDVRAAVSGIDVFATWLLPAIVLLWLAVLYYLVIVEPF